jgi:hypothetical protein
MSPCSSCRLTSAQGHYNCVQAGVAELADAWDLKSQARKGVRVRFPPPAPINTAISERFGNGRFICTNRYANHWTRSTAPGDFCAGVGKTKSDSHRLQDSQAPTRTAIWIGDQRGHCRTADEQGLRDRAARDSFLSAKARDHSRKCCTRVIAVPETIHAHPTWVYRGLTRFW